MTVLRIFFDAPPAAARAFAWALFNAHGVCFREGRSTAEHWPRGTKREAVLAADLAPLMAFKLPPLSASRLDSAIRLQLEDQLATPLSTQQIIIGTQQRDGWVRVVLTEQTLLEALRRFDIGRVFSETELVNAAADAWHWCVSPEGHGFVRRDSNNGGSAFALDLPSAFPLPPRGERGSEGTGEREESPPLQGERGASSQERLHLNQNRSSANYQTLPPELTLALSAETAPPKTLHIHAALSAEILSSWQRANHACRLTVEPPWRWTQVEPTLFAQATELLPQIESTVSSRTSGNGWRTAAMLVGIALALHVTATVTTWGSSLWQHWQISRGWQALANEAGLSAKKNTATIFSQWSRAYADARHRAGLAAPDDALPLLARAAPPLRTLPSGTLRNAVYADRAWTFEFTPLDAVTQKTLETSLRRTGLQPMSGSTATGYRLRIQTQEKAP
ncbi:MAG: hypothetical protein LBI35_02820 [Burkholderiales bacterium]|jgi:hypothetical protein|nr:hypothetical protein [Burkholderiales bacterium]